MMKIIIAVCGATFLLFIAVFQSRADIIAGPITNPANGHDYYLLTPNSWSASEAEAENLGGTLAIIKNAAEQEWVFSNFGFYGGMRRSLWIGLHRKVSGGAFYWMNESPIDYAHWCPGEPNNAGGDENCVNMRGGPETPGTWNDYADVNQLNAVVEISDKVFISESQRALVGDWYLSGRADHPCHIVGTKDALFAVNDGNRASQIVFSKKGVLFFTSWQIHGEIVEDKMLLSNGTWWSRKPMDYENAPNKDDAVKSTETKNSRR
jgi:hypothetical protein